MSNQKTAQRFKLNKSLSGILLMIIHAVSTSIIYIVGKYLAQSLHPLQVTFLYKFTILIAIIPWCFIGGIQKTIKTQKLSLHAARGAFSASGQVCFFYALAYIPVLDAVAISYLEHIILLIVGFLYFQEKVTSSKLVLIVFAFIGTLYVTKPGFHQFDTHYIFIFLALIFWAANNLTIKILGKTEHTKTQLFYGMLFSSILSFPLALYEWQPLTQVEFKYVLTLAPCYLIHAVAFFKAFKFTDMSTVMPFDYSRLIFTGVLGYIYLSEVPDQPSLIGYLLIMIGGIYFIQDEARKKGLRRK